MAKIYKRSDRITVKIDEVTVKLAPLTLDQKTQIQDAMMNGRTKADLKELTRGIALSMKFALKGIDGVEDSDGNQYQLKFEGDEVSDTCIDDLMNLEVTQKLSLVCASLVNGIPNKFTDENNKALKGVEIVKSEKATPLKNG